MNKFYMRLFGKPEFLKNNKAIKLSRLEWATVIYLYLFKRQSRAELADSIWKSRKARDNLRQQIAVLHEKGIPIKKILDSIELEEIETDCDTLLKLAQAKQYLAALDLIRGEFLYQVEDFVDLEGFQTSIKSERSNRKLEVFNLFFPAMDNLRSSGKLKCEDPKEGVLNVLNDLLEHENM